MQLALHAYCHSTSCAVTTHCSWGPQPSNLGSATWSCRMRKQAIRVACAWQAPLLSASAIRTLRRASSPAAAPFGRARCSHGPHAPHSAHMCTCGDAGPKLSEGWHNAAQGSGRHNRDRQRQSTVCHAPASHPTCIGSPSRDSPASCVFPNTLCTCRHGGHGRMGSALELRTGLGKRASSAPACCIVCPVREHEQVSCMQQPLDPRLELRQHTCASDTAITWSSSKQIHWPWLFTIAT